METVVLVAVILVMTGVGMWLIHLLNVQHAERIAGHRFGDTLPGVGRRHRGRASVRGGRPGPPRETRATARTFR
ncbi:hypothetical protein ACIP98_01170 [Streptomyces sp. NPDC088354]|uniref:hypothetical protein n=1 Tax=unclassified Streptomyces TaxID=2593676 RepID=UPI0029B56FF7|nr:hypothetical protein [Streptomyces sp. MI02-7b]MDX3073465.1 hypothetical protein [Streptomyces sp. MI02-7b]